MDCCEASRESFWCWAEKISSLVSDSQYGALLLPVLVLVLLPVLVLVLVLELALSAAWVIGLAVCGGSKFPT